MVSQATEKESEVGTNRLPLPSCLFRAPLFLLFLFRSPETNCGAKRAIRESNLEMQFKEENRTAQESCFLSPPFYSTTSPILPLLATWKMQAMAAGQGKARKRQAEKWQTTEVPHQLMLKPGARGWSQRTGGQRWDFSQNSRIAGTYNSNKTSFFPHFPPFFCPASNNRMISPSIPLFLSPREEIRMG